MNQINEAGNADPLRFAALRASFDMHHKLAEKHAADRDKAMLAVNAAEFGYANLLKEEVKTLALELDDIACAIREELHILTSPDDFRNQTKVIQGRVEEAYDDIMKLGGEIYEKNAARVAEADAKQAQGQ